MKKHLLLLHLQIHRTIAYTHKQGRNVMFHQRDLNVSASTSAVTSWFRSPYKKWESRALSSLSQMRRSTVNIIVGMFLVMVFYLIYMYVQYANTTLGPYSRTALHHTPLRTLWSICDVRTFLSLSLTGDPKQPGLESSRLRCWGRP